MARYLFTCVRGVSLHLSEFGVVGLVEAFHKLGKDHFMSGGKKVVVLSRVSVCVL